MGMDNRNHRVSEHLSPSAEVEQSRPSAFFTEAFQVFERAKDASGGTVDRFYSIAGHPVCLSFAGPALLPHVTPALEHLSSEPVSKPAITVYLWDSASTRTKMPPAPWSREDHLPRGEIRGYSDETIQTAFHMGSNVLSLFDSNLRVALYWTPDAREVPYYEAGAPIRIILHWSMAGLDRQLVHAGAVGTSAGAVLLAGKGGSGKSATALACVSAGLLYAGDDYVLLSGGPTPHVHSLYNSAKLDADFLQGLPHLLPKVSNSGKLDTEKAIIFLNDYYPERLAPSLPVRAVLVPRITGRPETKLRRSSTAEGLRALAPSSIFQLPGARAEAFGSIIDVVKRLPSYFLDLGTDIPRVHEAILGLLSGLEP